MENKDILKDGKLSSMELESYLEVYSIRDLVELHEYSSRVFEMATKVIEKMEEMKGKYDVCSSDEFFQVLLNTEKIYRLSAYIIKALSPIIIKDFDTDLFVEVERSIKDLITFKDYKDQLFFIPLINQKIRAFTYTGNLNVFFNFLNQNPGVMKDYFSRNPKAISEVLQCQRKKLNTIGHEENLKVSDLIFCIFYKIESNKCLDDFKVVEQLNFMDFRNSAMSYFVDEDGCVDQLTVPYDTSCLQPLPDEKFSELQVAENKSWEILNYLKEESLKVKAELHNYENLIIQKYNLPPTFSSNINHKKSTL